MREEKDNDGSKYCQKCGKETQVFYEYQIGEKIHYSWKTGLPRERSLIPETIKLCDSCFRNKVKI